MFLRGPPPHAPPPACIPSRRGRPPAAAVGAMTASRWVGLPGLPGDLRLRASPERCRAPPAAPHRSFPRGAMGAGLVPGSGEVCWLGGPLPCACGGCCVPGVLPTRERGCAAQTVPMARLRRWPRPARSAFPSHLPVREPGCDRSPMPGELPSPRWSLGRRAAVGGRGVTPLPSSCSSLPPPPPPAVFPPGMATAAAAAASPWPAAGRECGASAGAVGRAAELLLAVEQQPLPFAAGVCCRDVLLSASLERELCWRGAGLLLRRSALHTRRSSAIKPEGWWTGVHRLACPRLGLGESSRGEGAAGSRGCWGSCSGMPGLSAGALGNGDARSWWSRCPEPGAAG